MLLFCIFAAYERTNKEIELGCYRYHDLFSVCYSLCFIAFVFNKPAFIWL